MLTVGGTVVSPHSANRSGIITEAWRPESVPGLAARASAIREEGAIAACQLVHLGRETLGAEIWRHPVAPSAVRSPREPTRPRVMTDDDIDAVARDFVVSAKHAVAAGFQVIELHAAHGYLLAQFLSRMTNLREDGESLVGRAGILLRIADEIRRECPGTVVGVRVSAEGAEEAGLDVDDLCALLPIIESFDYVNVTVGVRTTYVRDMAVREPPLLGEIAKLRAATTSPLLISHAFRDGESLSAALEAGADLVGVARPLIADPDFPRKMIEGRSAEVRPCVSCNEDCRSFDPVLLCSVNPELSPPGTDRRPAEPLVLGPPRTLGGRVAIVGGGPAGLECAIRLGAAADVTLFEAADVLGGQLAIAASAPQRLGWRDLLDHYSANLGQVDVQVGHAVGPRDLGGFDDIVVAVGATEVAPKLEGVERAKLSAAVIGAGPASLARSETVVVVDGGDGGWRCVSAVEVALAAGAREVIVATPAASFAAAIPAESRVQLLRRLAGKPVRVCVLTETTAIGAGEVEFRDVLAGTARRMQADTVVVVGERRSLDWTTFETPEKRLQVIGDALVPRKVAHAVAEGYAAAMMIRQSKAYPSRSTCLAL